MPGLLAPVCVDPLRVEVFVGRGLEALEEFDALAGPLELWPESFDELVLPESFDPWAASACWLNSRPSFAVDWTVSAPWPRARADGEDRPLR